MEIRIEHTIDYELNLKFINTVRTLLSGLKFDLEFSLNFDFLYHNDTPMRAF
jgi:hypothetical protein